MASIWFNNALTLEFLNSLGRHTMGDWMGIQFVEIGADFLKATMPVNSRVLQPFGLLHGGASVALAETIGSVGAACMVDPNKYRCVGLEINANHVRSVTGGVVTAKAQPLHNGGKTQIWDIKITNEDNKLVCVSRLTVAVLPI